jgi:hypothetical protein
MEENVVYKPGIGLDIGTSFIVCSRMKENGEVEFKSERDAFFVMTPQGKANTKMIEQMLKQKGAFSLKEEGRFYVVGEHAISLANIRLQPVERPLKRGVLSDSEAYTFPMLAKLIESVVGRASVPNELCVYTFPANPIDQEDKDDQEIDAMSYHKNRLSEILRGLGYKPMPLLEAVALAYSELLEDNLTGIVLSAGAGMNNLAAMDMGEMLFAFSLAQGGDFIDRSVAKQQNISETIVQAEKESGINLLAPQDKLQKAISIYYDVLINYVADALEHKFMSMEKVPRFENKIPIVIGGGTSFPEGYLEKMSFALMSKKLPFEIGDIRRATHPDVLRSVSNGALIYAQMEMEE